MFSLKPTQTPPATTQLNGRTVKLIIRRHRRARRITLRWNAIKETVQLGLPPRVAIRVGLNFIEEKKSWLEAQAGQQKQFSWPEQGIRVDGTLWQLAAGPQSRGVVRAENGIITIPGAPEHQQRRLQDWLKKQARQKIENAALQHAHTLGVKITRISLRDTASRWGSCTTKGALSFSWRLILAPPEVLDYVVCHEVAHLKQMNHSPAFWAEVARLCPNYPSHRKWLTQHGQELHKIV